MSIAINLITDIRKKIIKSEFVNQKSASIFLNNNFSDNNLNFNLILKQFLFSILITRKFNEDLVLSKDKKFSMPLPEEWEEILKKKNINVSCFAKIKFNTLKIKYIIKGFLTLFRALTEKNKNIEKFVYLYNSSIQPNIEHKHNFFLWLKNFLKTEKLNVVTNNNINQISLNKISITKKNIFVIDEKKFFLKIIFFYFKFLKEFIFKFNDILFLSDEILKLYIIKINKIEPEKVYLDHSEALYKPLWIYEYEKKNIPCIVFFYSTNSIPITIDSDLADNFENMISHGWELYSWNNYYVWDHHQKNFLDKVMIKKKFKCEIVGPIPYENYKFKKLGKINKKILSIFDVSPFNPNFYNTLGLPFSYYNFENVKSFYKKILNNDLSDYDIVIKVKRINDNTDKNYIRLLDEIKKDYKVCENLSPFEIVEYSDKIVCMPFTSPALIAKKMNKNAVFFDPTKKLIYLNKFESFTHEIPLLDEQSLQKWIINNE